MKKKFNIFISLVLGVAFVIAAILVKKEQSTLFYVLLVAGCAIIFITVLEVYFFVTKKGEGSEDDNTNSEKKVPPEYRRKPSLITAHERKLYKILLELFSDKYDVIYQVALHSVIDKITQNSYRNELFRIVDFCLVDKSTFAPLLLIELNDSSHNRTDRIERDKKVNDICLSARMPIVAFKSHEINDVSHIRRVIKSNILKN